MLLRRQSEIVLKRHFDLFDAVSRRDIRKVCRKLLDYALGTLYSILLTILGHGILALAYPTTTVYSSYPITFHSAPIVALAGMVLDVSIGAALSLIASRLPSTEDDVSDKKFLGLLGTVLAFEYLMIIASTVVGTAILKQSSYGSPLLSMNYAARVGAMAGAAHLVQAWVHTQRCLDVEQLLGPRAKRAQPWSSSFAQV